MVTSSQSQQPGSASDPRIARASPSRRSASVALGGRTDIAVESADVIVLGDELSTVLTAREISRSSYRRVRQNVALAFLFNGIGIPLATTGLVHPVWAMIAMAVSVTTTFVNALGGRPSLQFDAIGSVGRCPVDQH